MISEKKRVTGIDLIKIAAACLVVAAHTLNADKGVLTFLVLVFTATAIPMFFLVNGYLVLSKKEVSVRYAARKIARILLVCFTWEALHAIAYFLYYHECRNFIESFFLDFFQKGLFFHFWFMGALILLYCIAPLLSRLLRKHECLYRNILIALGATCIIIDIIMVGTKNAFILEIPQNLRVWCWLFYYMLGGWIFNKWELLRALIKKTGKATKVTVIIGTILALILWQYLVYKIITTQYRIETLYGCFPVMLAVVVFFLWISGKTFSNKQEQVISHLARLSMGIYIFHPFILAVLKKFIPAFVEGNATMNLLFWLLTLAASIIVSSVTNAIPLVKRLIRL